MTLNYAFFLYDRFSSGHRSQFGGVLAAAKTHAPNSRPRPPDHLGPLTPSPVSIFAAENDKKPVVLQSVEDEYVNEFCNIDETVSAPQSTVSYRSRPVSPLLSLSEPALFRN